MASPDHRIFGLDLLRATAIVCVVLAHGRDLLGAYVPFEPIVPGIDPVDLFFVLSGYLIGGILLRMAARADAEPAHIVERFWIRRWIRTLPNYYLFLVLNIALVLFGVAPGVVNHNTPAYFVFLQNLLKPLDLFFWESWSLSVEVWFYTLFPVLLFLLLKGAGLGLKRSYLYAVLVLICIPAVLRSHFAEGVHTLHEADVQVRRLVVTRQDTIAFGALAAWFHVYFPAAWVRWRWPLFIVGITFLLFSMRFRSVEHLDYLNTWFLTFTACAMAALLPLLSGWSHGGIWHNVIGSLSRLAYAFFLIHLPLRAIFLVWVEDRSWPATVAIYVAWWATGLLLSAVVYRFYEKPFLDLRERFSLSS